MVISWKQMEIMMEKNRACLDYDCIWKYDWKIMGEKSEEHGNIMGMLA